MADLERIKGRIADIDGRRTNVTLEEIEWVVDQLSGIFQVRTRDARHGKLFRVGNTRFMINHHNPGNKQVKRYSVDDFCNAMTELGLLEA
jgi:hypothetical protein